MPAAGRRSDGGRAGDRGRRNRLAVLIDQNADDGGKEHRDHHEPDDYRLL